MILTLARGHYPKPVVDLWHDLRDVSREIRPDWDLSAPGLREAWEAGDLSHFHGWEKEAVTR